jgi:hypothetical protein
VSAARDNKTEDLKLPRYSGLRYGVYDVGSRVSQETLNRGKYTKRTDNPISVSHSAIFNLISAHLQRVLRPRPKHDVT